MAEYTRKQVIEEAQELAKKLSKIEEIDRFRQLEIKINENKKVQAHIAKIKALQKQAVNLQHYDKHGALEQVEAELDRYQKNWMKSRSFKNLKTLKLSSMTFCNV